MPNPFMCVVLSAMVLAGCAHAPGNLNAPNAADDPARLHGLWAMQPLQDGTAAVAEYRADGSLLLHPFNCRHPRMQPVQTFAYRLSADGQTIHVSSPLDTFDFKVLALTAQRLQLAREVGARRLTFDYRHVDIIAALCADEPGHAIERARRTPYLADDFVPAPGIPAHPGMDRYVGKWAGAENQMLLEIVRDPAGGHHLVNTGDENWHHLFNDVNWVGDELHFQSFAYSDNPRLFRHPFHKSHNAIVLQPTPDDRLRYTFFVDGERVSEVMTRMDD
ncbi:hypothetical protein IFU04_17440 [Pseudomonas syringae]|nr:hypothetical protein [Pseudomonas syringae]